MNTMTATERQALVTQIRALQAECDGCCSAGFELAGIALAIVDRLAEARRASMRGNTNREEQGR